MIVVGDSKSPKQVFLMLVRKILTEINTEEILIYLTAIFYVFNTYYPAGCSDLYCFLDIALLKLKEPLITIPPVVSNLLAHLAAISL